MAINIRKSKTDQLATVTPIRPAVDYPRLEGALAAAAESVVERTQELVPIASSAFGPVRRFGLLPDSTVTGRLLHNHGLPPRRSLLGGLTAEPEYDALAVTALPSRKNAEPPRTVKHLSEKPSEEKVMPAPVEKEGVEQVAPIDPSKTAAKIQRAMGHLGVIVWWGEHTKEFWVLDTAGLHSFPDVTSLYEGMEWDN